MVALLLCLGSFAVQEEERVAVLGVETRQPTKDEVARFGLSALAARPQGQVVDGEAPAGLRKGDVILQLGENKLFSRDDLLDFVAVSKPGAQVKARVKRGDTGAEEEVEIALGERKIPAKEKERFVWEFAGPAQLQAPLDEAKKRKTQVIFGLSGAET